MKRFICTALAATMALSLFSACKPQEQTAVKITPEPEATAVSEVTKAPEPTTEPTEEPTAEPTNTPEPKAEKLDIPVYPDEELFFTPCTELNLGQDYTGFIEFSIILNDLDRILEMFPTDALRKADTGEEYIIYDSEGGYREYIFLRRLQRRTITKGYYIVIGDMRSYSDFAQLKVGDPIEDVEKIDSVASLFKRQFLDVDGYVPETANEAADSGYPLCSIHYLTDGILKIDYDMLDDRSLVISNTVYSPDYTLLHRDMGDDGIIYAPLNYRIEPIDLPEK